MEGQEYALLRQKGASLRLRGAMEGQRDASMGKKAFQSYYKVLTSESGCIGSPHRKSNYIIIVENLKTFPLSIIN